MHRGGVIVAVVLLAAMLWHGTAARSLSSSTAVSGDAHPDRRLQEDEEAGSLPGAESETVNAAADEAGKGTDTDQHDEAEENPVAGAAGAAQGGAWQAAAADPLVEPDAIAAEASQEESVMAGAGQQAVADDELAERNKAIGAGVGGDKEEKQPETDFVRDDPQWLAEAAAMTDDFMATPAVEHLAQGRLGDLEQTELGFDAVTALRKAVHSTLARCSHTTQLALEENGGLPRLARLEPCTHRHLTLLFLLEPDAEMPEPAGPMAISSSLSSVNARLFAFAKQLKGRGHQVLIAGPDELEQVDFSTLSAVIAVKTLGRAFEAVRGKGVPIIWDHVDYWGEMPFYQLDLWELKTAFAGVFTANRVTQAAFRTASVPAHILYHNHANYAGFHRADRSSVPRLLALQGDFRGDVDLDVIGALQGFSDRNSLEFRYGKYTGRGRDVWEMSGMLSPGVQDFGDQLRYVMGMGSVDVAVLWPKNYGQFDVCYKPTSRLSQFASLGIPVVAYPFASYIDMFVEFGYPFVASTVPELEEMLGRLINSAALRQAASRVLLDMAKYLSVEELTVEYESGLCSFLSGAAGGNA